MNISLKIKSYLIWYQRKRKGLVPQMGREQITQRGHRAYVGAKWNELGALQFEFLKLKGLLPHHVLYDIACGSLRAGIHFIPYLSTGNYCGIEKENSLVEAGINIELGQGLYKEKTPEFVISDRFEFEKFSKAPDYAIAQSLFTHLTLSDISTCLAALRKVASNDCLFYATFDEEGKTPKSKQRQGVPNPPKSHSNLTFYYSKNEIQNCGRKTGWKFEYIGDWGHPSKQQMVLYYL